MKLNLNSLSILRHKNQMKNYRIIYLFILLFIAGLSFGQTAQNPATEFVKVYKTETHLIVPFPKIETEVSDRWICFRNVLPPRQTMRESFLETYDKWDQQPKYRPMDSVDYDSIVNYIMTSGLLNIDLNYTKPDTTGGVIRCNSGGGSITYVIETTEGRINLLISGNPAFILPLILKEFDDLFVRITKRYKLNGEK
jgi:hypothetical protein